jgi:ankyrin repeat protein
VSVQLLLAAKANPNTRDEDGIAPLSVACDRGDAQIVNALIDAKAAVNDVRPDGISALALCAGNSTAPAVEKLIAGGANVNDVSPLGQTPLMRAAARGNVANIQLLVKHGAAINKASNRGFTPLFFAIQSGVTDAPLTVLKLGGDAKYVSPDGATSLELALLRGDFPLATVLVENGADVRHWDVNGYQPLHLAAMSNNVEFAKLLLSKGVDINVLTKQAYRVIPGERSNDHVSWWPDNDPSVKVVMMHRSDNAGLPPPPPARPALFIAAQEGSVDMMKLLAAAGAKADFRAGDGSNLVLAAIPSGKTEVVRYAIQLNPDINAVTENGTGAIQLALNSSNNIFALQDGYEVEPILRLLADKGAKLDSKNSRGQTPQSIIDRSSDEIKEVWASILKAHGVGQVAAR